MHKRQGKVGADMKCDRNVCEQQYSFGRCNVKCLSSVMPGVCRQVCNFGICEFMTFNAAQSIQISHDAKCVITCPLGAKNCPQFGYVLLPGRITMKCDLPHWSINLYKGGNFIYPMMHRFMLYYQASERT